MRLHRRAKHGIETPGGGCYSPDPQRKPIQTQTEAELAEAEDQPIQTGETVFKKQNGTWGFF